MFSLFKRSLNCIFMIGALFTLIFNKEFKHVCVCVYIGMHRDEGGGGTQRLTTLNQVL